MGTIFARWPRTVVATLLVSSFLVPVSAGAQEPPAAAATNGFVVVLAGGADAVAEAPGLANASGSAVTHVFDQLGAFAIEANPAAAEALARHPLVDAVVPNQTFSLFDDSGWGFFRIDADDAHQPANGDHRGAGTRIIVIDSGVDLDHPDLVANLDVAAGTNCVNLSPGALPDDDHGHGTHVAGIAAAAEGPNGFGVVGVAPDASVVPIKSFDATGNATTAQVLCGINHAITVASDAVPTVVNMSFGETGSDSVCDGAGTDVLHEAVCALADTGAIVVAASGNSSTNTSTFVPALFDEVIAVSAYADLDGVPGALGGCTFSSELLYDCDDTWADFSNYGRDVDVMAPGFNIYSSLNGGGHGNKSGTSMAAPHVAGVVSLMLESDSSMTADEAQAVLQDTGECPSPPGAASLGGPVCDQQGKWVGDPDSYTEPLVNALRAAQRAGDPVRWISPRAGTIVPGIIDVDIKISETTIGTSDVRWNVDGGPWQTSAFDAMTGYYVASWDATSSIPGDYTLIAEANDGASVMTDDVLVTVPRGQFAHWALDDGTGQTAVDSTANAWDANLSNGPSWVDGRFGAGLSFDGTDDYLDVPAGVADGVGDMTMALWVKLDAPGSHALISGANAGNSNELLMFLKSDAEMRFFTGESSGSYVSWNVSSLSDGTWHHLAIVRDAAGNSVEFFVDGSSEGARATPVGAVSISDGGLVLGQEQDAIAGGFDPAQALDGTLDEIYFFDRVLTSVEIADLATAPVDTTPPSAPDSLAAVATGLDVALSWTPGADAQSGIDTYRIYRDTAPGGQKGLLEEVAGSELVYVDSDTVVDTTYYYEVTAVNGSNLEGDPSGEANATTSEPTDPALIGYWAMDDAAGVVATDSSDFHRDGMVFGSQDWGTGVIGGALSFAPSTDRVDLPSEVLNGVGDLSVALWTRIESGGSHALVSGANPGNSNELLIFLKSPTELRLFTGERSNSILKWTIAPLADGRWHHVVVVRDATNDRAELFIDGISQGSKSSTIGPLTISNGGLVLGQEQDSVGGGYSTSQALDGSLDEVMFYDRLIDAAEIAALATPPPDTTPPSAVEAFSAAAVGLDVNLAWSAAVDAESGISAYRVYRGVVAAGPKQLLVEVPGSVLSYSDIDTDPETTYFYEVTAVSGVMVEGPPSEEREATTAATEAGLVGHWTFDEGSGLVAADSAAGNDGSLSGVPTWGVGRIAGGLVLDGVDDAVDVPAGAADGLGDMTVALWVKLDGPGEHALVSGANSDNSNELLLFIKSATQIRFFTGQRSNTYAKWTVPALDDGSWHHVAVVRDSAGSRLELFLDGESQGVRSKTVPTLSISAGGLVFGQEQDSVGGGYSPAQALDGTLDDVRFYDRLLSAQKIGALANP